MREKCQRGRQDIWDLGLVPPCARGGHQLGGLRWPLYTYFFMQKVPTARGCCENRIEGQGEIPQYGLKEVHGCGRAGSTFCCHSHYYEEL